MGLAKIRPSMHNEYTIKECADLRRNGCFPGIEALMPNEEAALCCIVGNVAFACLSVEWPIFLDFMDLSASVADRLQSRKCLKIVNNSAQSGLL